jgi:hypothetical protein
MRAIRCPLVRWSAGPFQRSSDPVARPVPVEIPISEDRTCYDISPDFMAPKAIEKLKKMN